MTPDDAVTAAKDSLAARLHGALVARVEAGTDAMDAATRAALPGNFLKILASYLCMKVGDVCANPKTVLAWFASAVGAPAIVVSLLVPVREAGALLPQLLLTGFVRARRRRKWAWVAGAVGQGIAVLGLGLAGLAFGGAAAGALMLVSLALFALSRSLGSLATKDVVAAVIPKGQRGQLSGVATGAAGAVGLVAGLALLFLHGPVDDVAVLARVLLAAALLWFAGAAIYAGVREPASEPEVERPLTESLARLSLIVSDRAFRDFVIVRGLFVSTALMAPFVVVLGHRELGAGLPVLGGFVVADGLGAMVGAPVWGRFADRSSRGALRAAAALAVVAGGSCALLAKVFPGAAWLAVALPIGYFVLALAHAGVRVARSTYLVDFAGEDRRTDYVAVSNTLIGVVLLAVGSVGLLEARLGVTGVLGVLALCGLVGVLWGQRLKEA